MGCCQALGRGWGTSLAPKLRWERDEQHEKFPSCSPGRLGEMVLSSTFYPEWERFVWGQIFGEGDVDRPRCQAHRLRDAPQYPGPGPNPVAGSRPQSLAPPAASETTAPETALKARQWRWRTVRGSAKPLVVLSQPPGSRAPGEPLCRATGLRLPGCAHGRVAPAQGIQPGSQGAERIPWAW